MTKSHALSTHFMCPSGCAAALFAMMVAWSGSAAAQSPYNPGQLVYRQTFDQVAPREADVKLPEWSRRATSDTIPGRRFLGTFGPEPTVLTLASLPPHDVVTIEFNLFVLGSWDGDAAGGGPDSWRLSADGVNGGAPFFSSTFSNTGSTQSYPVPGAAERTGAFESCPSEACPDGVFPFGYTVYHLKYTFAHGTDILRLNFIGAANEAADNESWGLDNVEVSVRPSAVAVVGWGDNSSGQLADAGGPIPHSIAGVPNVIALAPGGFHSLALKSDGTVWAWGRNAEGQLGDNSFVRRDAPVQARENSGAPLVDVTAIAAGAHFSLALKADGTVWGWGSNLGGQLGTGGVSSQGVFGAEQISAATVNTVVSIAAGQFHAHALKADGTVVRWGSLLGNTHAPEIIPAFGGIVAIAAGAAHSLALKTDGTVWGWGDDRSGQVAGYRGLQPQTIAGVSDVVALAAGGSFSLALHSNGTASGWGGNGYGQVGGGGGPVPQLIAGAEGLVAITAGVDHSLGLTSDGAVLGWGRGDVGQLGAAGGPVPQPVSTIAGAAVQAGGFHSLALVTSGALAVDPAGLDFRDQGIGISSAAQFVRVGNPSTAARSIVSVDLGGMNPQDYALVDRCSGLTVDPGGACEVEVTFTPVATGARSAAVRVATDQGDLATVPLTGTGVNFAPVAKIAVALAPVGSPTTFDANGSYDLNPGDSLTYAWDLDVDGSFEVLGVRATRAYASPGRYSVVLRVIDGHGFSSTLTREFEISSDTLAPSISIGSPLDGGVYDVHSVLVAEYRCDDDFGLASCDGNVANLSAIDSSVPGQKTFAVTATDTAGNLTERTARYTIRKPAVLAVPYLYVSNNRGASVSVIDTGREEVVATVQGLPGAPYSIAMSPDASRAYVAMVGGGIAVINIADDSLVETIQTGGGYGVGLSPDGRQLYAPIFGANSVAVIDTTTGQTTATIPVGTNPYWVTVSSDGRTAYVSNIWSHSVSVVDLVLLTVRTEIPVGQNPHALAIAPDGRKLYVVNQRSATVSVIDLASETVIATIPGVDNPVDLSFAPDGMRLYVTHVRSSGMVSIIDTRINQQVGLVGGALGAYPLGIAIAQDGLSGYVAVSASNHVSLIDLMSDTAIRTIPVGEGPAGIALTPLDHLSPTISVTSPAEAEVFALNEAVTASFACADDGRLLSCEGSTTNGAQLATSSSGARMFSVTARDAAGRSTTLTVNYTVEKGVPSITWPAPEAVAYHVPLGPVQLNATADIPGTFTYSPSAGAMLGFGPRELQATFTPSDGANYEVVEATRNIDVFDDVAPTMAGVSTDLVVEATDAAGSAATWTAPSADDYIDGTVAVTCVPASGTVFPLGATTVMCAASDASGNRAEETFLMTVRDTTAPSVRIISPIADAMLSSTLLPVTIAASDTVGVQEVTINGSTVSLTGGVWHADIPITLPAKTGERLVLTATATDLGGNSSAHVVIVDNDGISAAIDRSLATGIDQSDVFSNEFTDGTTYGFVTRGQWAIGISNSFGGVRVSASTGSGPAARVSACGGNKYVAIDMPGEMAQITCGDSGTMTVAARQAMPDIKIYKLVTNVSYQRYCYRTSRRGYRCYDVPQFYTYWSVISLRTGQTASTGSPVRAGEDNAEPIDVTVVEISDDGTERVVASYLLDAGESADVQIEAGVDGADDTVNVNVLRGTVPITVGASTQVVGEGETARVTNDTIPPAVGPVADLTVEATSPAGAAVDYVLPHATDTTDGAPVVTGNPPRGAIFPIGETPVTITATDGAGNASTATFTVIVRDTTAPLVECEAADALWHASNVTLACVAHDTAAGLAQDGDAAFTLTTTVPEGAEIADASTASRGVCDRAGNCATAGPLSSNRIDRKGPAISVDQPGAVRYLVNQPIAAAYLCSDTASGVANCDGSVPNGGAIDTTTPGNRSFTVDAADAVGNGSAASVSYTVGYAVRSLHDPTKAVRSGATIPIKVQIVDAAGQNRSSGAITLNAETLTLASTQADGVIEDSGNANPDNNFRYDPSLGGYVFNLNTSGRATGTYDLRFRVLADPTLQVTQFKVR